MGRLFLSSQQRTHDRYEPIRQDIEREIEAGRATGVAVALAHRGKIVWEEGFGWADKERKKRATPDTPFSLASVTKSFTTTALMTLVEAGKVSLDTAANDYLGPEKIKGGASDPAKVTLRALASHSAGLPGMFTIYPEGGAEKQPSMDEVIREHAFVVTPPGEHFYYSNVGLGILAHIVARQSHCDFGIYLHDNVLEPLGLDHSFFDTDVTRRGEMAQRYDDTGKVFPFYVTSTPGTGEMYASAHDVARFAMFHLKDHLKEQERILTDEQVDELHRPQIPMIADRSYGLGWMIGRAYDGSTVVYHNGNQPGVAAVMMLLPGRDIACVVLTNHDGDEALMERVRNAAIRTLVPGWSWKTFGDSSPQPLPPGYEGRWRGYGSHRGKDIPADLTIDGKESIFQIRDHPPQPITALGLVDGLVVGKTRGDIAVSAMKPGQKDLALRLARRRLDLAGEIDVIEPIPHARTSNTTPFWIQLARKASMMPKI